MTYSTASVWSAALLGILISGIAPVAAQDSTGKVAGSAVGELGQRQRRDQEIGGVEPLARVNSRIQNRVQSRVRSRIDRYYDPRANSLSPFAVAGEQARAASRPN